MTFPLKIYFVVNRKIWTMTEFIVSDIFQRWKYNVWSSCQFSGEKKQTKLNKYHISFGLIYDENEPEYDAFALKNAKNQISLSM